MDTKTLHDEIFGYLISSSKEFPDFYHSQVSRYKDYWNHGKLTSSIFSLIGGLRRSSSKYIFIGTKFIDLILGLPKNDIVVYGGNSDFLTCLKYGIKFKQFYDIIETVLIASCSLESDYYILNCINVLACEDNKENERFLVLSNDSLPVERLFIKAAQLTGRRTICIQDGLFQSDVSSTAIHGSFADMMLVFDTYQQNILANKGVSLTRLKVLGFHSNGVNPTTNQNLNSSSRSICILSQPWPQYDRVLGSHYISLLEMIVNNLNKHGFSFMIKPHPAEKKASYLKKQKLFRGNMSDCLNSFDIFISFTSTALLEASLARKVAIQIRDNVFNSDNFQDIGYAYTIDSSEVDTLPFLIKSLNPIYNDNLTQMVTPNITDRFLTAIYD